MDNKQNYRREIAIFRIVVFFRRILKVSWLDRVSNKIVLDKFGSHRSLINVITKRQMSFLAIYVEKKNLENLVSRGTIEGKRARGRQRKDYISGIRRRMAQSWSGSEIIHHTKDRDIWGAMITNVDRQDT